jgi:hypothetical protein
LLLPLGSRAGGGPGVDVEAVRRKVHRAVAQLEALSEEELVDLYFHIGRPADKQGFWRLRLRSAGGKPASSTGARCAGHT